MMIYSAYLPMTGKRYVGKTKSTLQRRWKRHCKSAKNPRCHFHNAIQKYGREYWVQEVLEDGIEDPDVLNEREIYWIAYYDSCRHGYNSTGGGDGQTNITEETKRKYPQR